MENELMHHGTKGMRWGIRRYQNKDGTLTPAGKKRYNKEMERLKTEAKVLKNRQRTQAKLNKLEEKRQEVEALKGGKSLPKSTKKTSGPSARDLSDAELKSVVNRLTLEAQYKKLRPEEVSKGKKFVNYVMKNVITPAATEVGKNVLKDAMTNAVKKASEESSKKK